MTGLENHIAELILAGFVGTLTALFGLLKWFARTYLDQSSEKVRELSNEIQAVKRDFQVLLVNLPRDFVAREDWMRAVTITDSKVDALNTKLDRLIERKP